MDETIDSHLSGPRWRLAFRLSVGLAQGLTLAFLADAAQAKHWPFQDPLIFGAAVAIATFWPVLLLVSINIRRTLLLAWAIVGFVLIAGLAAYDVWRVETPSPAWPSGQLWAAYVPLLFIAYSLIAAADADARPIADYPTYFDTAWKLALQIGLALAFVGLFWIVMFIGAEMFHLIGLDFLHRLLDNKWFDYPASALSFAYAIELTDVRVGLVRGLRTLALMLQSWILPVMVGLAVAFLAALPFTGLAPLWSTRHATALLLTAAAALVFLMNAAYRDGDRDEGGPALLVRLAGTIGAVALAPLVAIACYALALRIAQYGLTPDRVTAFFCCAIAACLAIGYLIAAINIGGWLKALETTNVIVAIVAILSILALFTPIADPARLSVDDQVARLAHDKVSADDFDYDFLRFRSGRFGREKLAELAKRGAGKDADKVATLAANAQKRVESPSLNFTAPKPTPAEIAALITVHPDGASLPAGFLDHDWTTDVGTAPGIPACLRGVGRCDAVIVELDAAPPPEILIVDGDYDLSVFGTKVDGSYGEIGRVEPLCAGFADALKAGKFGLAEAPYRDIVVDGAHLRPTDPCPAK